MFCPPVYTLGCGMFPQRLVRNVPLPKINFDKNPSRPVQVVAIELGEYEAYEVFPTCLIVTDLTRFSVKRQINVYSNSSVRRESPCFPLLVKVRARISTHCCTSHRYSLRHFFVVFNHSKLGGVIWEPGTVITASISFFCLSQRVITWIVPRTFRRYISTSGSPSYHSPALIKSFTGQKS